jgi:hypothetical protein
VIRAPAESDNMKTQHFVEHLVEHRVAPRIASRGGGVALLLLACAVALCGCGSVKPWEKGDLAKPAMAFDSDPLQSRLEQHIYFSKENASGGYGVGGGGCGCN